MRRAVLRGVVRAALLLGLAALAALWSLDEPPSSGNRVFLVALASLLALLALWGIGETVAEVRRVRGRRLP